MKKSNKSAVEMTEVTMTRPLRRAVNLLGELLGKAVRDQAGQNTFEEIERLRVLCKEAYDAGKQGNRETVLQRIQKHSLPDIHWLLRGFTAYFHLVNKAEQFEIVRINRERELASSAEAPRSESISDAVLYLKKKGYSADEVISLFQRLDIQPTLTAHPTEARRRSILFKQQAIAECLKNLHAGAITERERQQAISGISQQIALLLTTDEIRAERPTVLDEVQQGLHFLTTSIWQIIPEIHEDIRHALKIHYGQAPDLSTLLQYRSWIGGDRDGNPKVTAEVTTETLRLHRATVLSLYMDDLRQLRRDLSISSRLVEVPDFLQESIAEHARQWPIPEATVRRFQHEPFRLKIIYIMGSLLKEIEAAKSESSEPNSSSRPIYAATHFIEDLEVLQRALKVAGHVTLADNAILRSLIVRARTFGFHLAALDIRQHSLLHEQAVSELLQHAGVTEKYEKLAEADKLTLLTSELKNPRPLVPRWAVLSPETQNTIATFVTIRKAQLFDSRAISSYIISMTHEVSDMLEVLLLAKESGLWRYENGKVESDLDLVPLLETIDDLQGASSLLDSLFSSPVYQSHLQARKGFQEIMLGYSDSNKDGGPWMANWALHKGQSEIAQTCRKHRIDFRLFHGRGGTVGRGGGRANRAILALPPITYTGRIRFTEQGEVITFRYAMPQIAHRHLEQIMHAMLVAADLGRNTPVFELDKGSSETLAMMEELANLSMQTYQNLLGHEDFWTWYVKTTPIEHISQLPIASRPVSRKSAQSVDFEGLRAIPWVFAWTQTRFNVPGWFGVGTALQTIFKTHPNALETLQQLYSKWPYLRTVIDNTQLELRRTHLSAAHYYAENSPPAIAATIESDYEKACRAVCTITGQDEVLDNDPVLQQSIALRNPYTDVLNFLQVELMRRWRNADTSEREALSQALFLSIDGIAAAMQSTG